MIDVAHPDANRYLEQQIATATPAMLTSMLFDALVANSSRAIDLFEAGDKISGRRWLIRAQEIVIELRFSLDAERGGDLARNLDRIYDFAYQQLLSASSNGDPSPVRVAVELITPLRESWRAACVDGGVTVR